MVRRSQWRGKRALVCGEARPRPAGSETRPARSGTGPATSGDAAAEERIAAAEQSEELALAEVATDALDRSALARRDAAVDRSRASLDRGAGANETHSFRTRPEHRSGRSRSVSEGAEIRRCRWSNWCLPPRPRAH